MVTKFAQVPDFVMTLEKLAGSSDEILFPSLTMQEKTSSILCTLNPEALGRRSPSSAGAGCDGGGRPGAIPPLWGSRPHGQSDRDWFHAPAATSPRLPASPEPCERIEPLELPAGARSLNSIEAMCAWGGAGGRACIPFFPHEEEKGGREKHKWTSGEINQLMDGWKEQSIDQ